MKKNLTWIILFGLLFLLSLDFWNWDQPVEPGPLGLPLRVWYFAVLQILFAIVFFFFSKRFWKMPDEEEPAP